MNCEDELHCAGILLFIINVIEIYTVVGLMLRSSNFLYGSIIDL